MLRRPKQRFDLSSQACPVVHYARSALLQKTWYDLMPVTPPSQQRQFSKMSLNCALKLVESVPRSV
eukprot:12115241-Heterocapsa_arctica.AAC.1